jgi:hypothetical protein
MNSLIGIWLYSSLIYQGHPTPRPDDSLKMYYSFENNNTNEIFYYRSNEEGFCKRKATYEVKNDEILQTVVSVDENNANFCAQDRDMQIGQVSTVKYSIVDNQLLLELPLGEETLTYVWDRTANQ